jgi:hypothetical protein
MTQHILIQPTWACHNSCAYCWVRATVGQRPALHDAPEREPSAWIAALQRDKVELCDIAGGEPLLYPDLWRIIRACPKTDFGLSTNGLALDALRWLCTMKPDNLLGINVSYHPQSGHDAEFMAAVSMVRNSGGPVRPNVVNWGDNVGRSISMLRWLNEQGIPFDISPFEDMGDLVSPMRVGLTCKGYLVVAPDGQAWPCLTTLRSPRWAEAALGNWLDGTVDWERKATPCYENCVDFYVLAHQHSAGDMWGAEARPCEVVTP